MEPQWHDAHYDVLGEIFKHLPARERMACFFVCRQWREALENPLLWRTAVVHLDTDLFGKYINNHLLLVYHKKIVS